MERNYLVIVTDNEGNAYGIEQIYDYLLSDETDDFVEYVMEDVNDYLSNEDIEILQEEGSFTARDILFKMDADIRDEMINDHFDTYLDEQGYKYFKVWNNGQVEEF